MPLNESAHVALSVDFLFFTMFPIFTPQTPYGEWAWNIKAECHFYANPANSQIIRPITSPIPAA
jgi:hypothetical protein